MCKLEDERTMELEAYLETIGFEDYTLTEAEKKALKEKIDEE